MPATLKTIVSMVLNALDLRDINFIDSRANFTISQVIVFNFKKCALFQARSHRSIDRKPPLPLYNEIKIHIETKLKKIITEWHDLGLNISYDRVLQLKSQFITTVCENFWKKELWNQTIMDCLTTLLSCQQLLSMLQ